MKQTKVFTTCGVVLLMAAIMAGTVLATQERPHTVAERTTIKQEDEPCNYTYIDLNTRRDTQTALTDEEIEELTRVVYLEAGAESDFCIRCVTDVAFNQLASGLFGATMSEVLRWPGNYDETFPYIWTKEPTDRVREIVRDVIENGVTLPARIIFYRNAFYHPTWWAVPEFTTDNVFFSSSRWYQ